ncbi:hypothetical protein Hanom_Chr12g01099721 [Helianthus anomalus]
MEAKNIFEIIKSLKISPIKSLPKNYGGAWVGVLLIRGMGVPPPLKLMPMGYGGAWVGGMSLIWPLRTRHVTLLARPTPGFKPTSMGPRPKPTAQPKPSG